MDPRDVFCSHVRLTMRVTRASAGDPMEPMASVCNQPGDGGQCNP